MKIFLIIWAIDFVATVKLNNEGNNLVNKKD